MAWCKSNDLLVGRQHDDRITRLGDGPRAPVVGGGLSGSSATDVRGEPQADRNDCEERAAQVRCCLCRAGYAWLDASMPPRGVQPPALGMTGLSSCATLMLWQRVRMVPMKPALAYCFPRTVLLTLVAAGMLFVAGCGVLGDDEKPVIRLYDSEWDSLSVNNAIVRFIIEHGYGYPTESVVLTTFVMQEALSGGEVDVNLEGWQQNIPDWYEEQIANGTIVNLGTTYEDSSQFFLIPRWVGEQYTIETVFDMRDHWELFQDPQDPSKGVFYSCDIGSQCTEINRVKLEAYGLDKYYNAVTPSLTVLAGALAAGQERRQPVFGYHWSPTALVGAYEWHALDEPAYSEACWERIISASDGGGPAPDEACAYQSVPIDALAQSGLQNKAPDIVEMLQKLNVGLGPLNETLAWALEHDIDDDWERAAVHYLRTYQDRWRTWVTPAADERISEALDEN